MARRLQASFRDETATVHAARAPFVRKGITMRTTLASVALASVLGVFAGCSSDGDSDRYRSTRDDDFYRDRSVYRDRDYDDRYRDTRASDAARQAGDRNTRITDLEDDGRLNNSARSYEERKASRAADEGDRDAARKEAELRRERLDR